MKMNRGKKTTWRVLSAALAASVMLGIGGCGSTKETDNVTNAMLKISDRDFEGAVQTLNEAKEGGENSRALNRALGIALMGAGDYEGAIGAFETALGKSSGIPDSFDYDINFYLATCFYKLGNLEESKNIFTTILKLQPGNAVAYRLRACVEAEGWRHRQCRRGFSPCDRACTLGL